MGNTEALPSVGLLSARMLEITGDWWGDRFGRKGSCMTGGGCVSLQERVLQHWDLSGTHTQHFFVLVNVSWD